MSTRAFLVVLLFCGYFANSPATAAPIISNRNATIDEMGYLPDDKQPAAVNPPPIAWLTEKGAASWDLEVAADAEFSSATFGVEKWPFLMYTHTQELQPGRYFWRYRFSDKNGQHSNWSTTRQFDIANTATIFPRPSKAYLDSTIPDAHPRMFMRPESVTRLRDPETTNPAALTKLLANADNALRGPIMAEPKPWSKGKWDAAEWGQYLRDASSATFRMDLLAFAWLLTEKPAYGARAKAHLMEYVTWDPHGPSSMKINDEVGMPMLHSISRAYDWLHPLLTDDEKELVKKHVRARGEETFDHMRRRPYEQFVYNSHFGRMFHFLGEAGLAFYGEIPEAEKWLNYAMTIFYGWYPLWGGRDGGWAEGMAYFTSYNVRMTWWLDLMKYSLKIDGTTKPFYANVGDFPMFVRPPGNPVSGFGDFSERPVYTDTLKNVMSYFAMAQQRGDWQWYAEQLDGGNDAGPFGYIAALEPRPEAVRPTNLQLLKMFPEVGYAAFNSDLTSSANNLHMAMRASPRGNASHSHSDQNAIVMAAYGEPLLVNTGTRDFYGSPFCKQYYWETLSHNAILFDGKGQPKDKAARASYVAHGQSGDIAWVVGDATRAYSGLVELYRRWTVFVPEYGAILIDEVKSTASIATLMFHGRAPFEHDESVREPKFRLTKEKVTLEGSITAPNSTNPVTLTHTDHYPIPLGNGKQPLFDEWHLKADVTLSANAEETQYIITCLEVGRAGDKAITKSLSSTQMNDIMRIRFNGRSSFTLNFDLKNLIVERTE